MNPKNFFLKTIIDTPKFDSKLINNSLVAYSDHQTKLFLSSVPVDEILDKKILKLFKKCDMVPTGFRFFKWQPNQYNLWHLDGIPNKLMNFSMNWILSGAGEIQWNTTLNLTAYKDVAYSAIPSSSTDEYDISTTGHQCFINTAIPHRVVTGVEGRTSLCLSWDNHSYDLTFQDACERLQSVGLAH